MILGTVVGTTTSTIKHSSMDGWRLLVVQGYGVDGVQPDGEPVLAIDRLGAGAGARVVISSDGKLAQEWTRSESTPVRWTVIGIVD